MVQHSLNWQALESVSSYRVLLCECGNQGMRAAQPQLPVPLPNIGSSTGISAEPGLGRLPAAMCLLISELPASSSGARGAA